ncbi:MAG: sulfatase-like hydrolase/transferase [Verrucomicrobiaceae bacterium]|nr:sulfatase-like hydrolase/transferase [Verrucomicrobiaceae bacterium]
MRIFTTFFISVAMMSAVNAAERPNFVWIISEDNSIHYLDHFFAGGADTPNIKALAAHGITYDHAFSNSPVCSVARSTLITGCYAPRIGTQYHRRSVMAPMPEGVRMFPAYLRSLCGYYTTNRSKTDYNAKPGKGVWDESSNKAHWRKRKQGQPFFHKASYAISHESSLHFSAQAMASQPTRHDPGKIKLAPYHPDTPTLRYTHARYLDNIVKIDEVVGRVIAELKEDGVLEDTFIFYFGDHGGVLPRSKGYAYESGLHVPLVVRIPDNFRHLVKEKKGSREKGFVEFIDFGPTVLNLAGADIPGKIDGRPFLGKGARTREFTFGYADRFDEKYDLVRWIRKGRFSYQRNYQPFNFDSLQNDYRYKQLAFQQWRQLYREGKLNAEQRQFFEPRAAEALYDIEKDPHEVNNLSGDPRYSDTLVLMRNLLHEKVTGINDLSLFPEPYMVSDAMDNPERFGRLHAARVARLVDIADLQIVEFSRAKEGIESALQSNDPWARYWGCIVASSHGQAPQDLADLIEILALDDPEPLVRCRAAEFLGITGDVDPRPIIKAALKMSKSEVATNLILNTAVLLQDGRKKIKFDGLTREDVNHSGRYVEARLAYLSGRKPPAKVRKKKTKKG